MITLWLYFCFMFFLWLIWATDIISWKAFTILLYADNDPDSWSISVNCIDAKSAKSAKSEKSTKSKNRLTQQNHVIFATSFKDQCRLFVTLSHCQQLRSWQNSKTIKVFVTELPLPREPRISEDELCSEFQFILRQRQNISSQEEIRSWYTQILFA